MICREGAWAFNRFVHLRCLRFTAPKGIRQNNSGAQRKGNYFYFAVAGAVSDPEEGGGGGAWVHASPLGHQSGHIPWGTSRAPFLASKGPFQKGPFWLQRGPFWCQETVLAPGANLTQKAQFTPKSAKFIFSAGPFQFQESLLSFRGLLLPPWKKFCIHQCGHIRSARYP